MAKPGLELIRESQTLIQMITKRCHGHSLSALCSSLQKTPAPQRGQERHTRSHSTVRRGQTWGSQADSQQTFLGKREWILFCTPLPKPTLALTSQPPPGMPTRQPPLYRERSGLTRHIPSNNGPSAVPSHIPPLPTHRPSRTMALHSPPLAKIEGTGTPQCSRCTHSPGRHPTVSEGFSLALLGILVSMGFPSLPSEPSAPTSVAFPLNCHPQVSKSP